MGKKKNQQQRRSQDAIASVCRTLDHSRNETHVKVKQRSLNDKVNSDVDLSTDQVELRELSPPRSVEAPLTPPVTVERKPSADLIVEGHRISPTLDEVTPAKDSTTDDDEKAQEHAPIDQDAHEVVKSSPTHSNKAESPKIVAKEESEKEQDYSYEIVSKDEVFQDADDLVMEPVPGTPSSAKVKLEEFVPSLSLKDDDEVSRSSKEIADHINISSDPDAMPEIKTASPAVDVTPSQATAYFTAESSPVPKNTLECNADSSPVPKNTLEFTADSSPVTKNYSEAPSMATSAVTEAVRATNPVLDQLLQSIALLEKNDASLVNLDLTDCPVFSMAHGSALAAALKTNTCLEALSLKNTKLQNATAMEIAEVFHKFLLFLNNPFTMYYIQALEVNKTLKVLNMENNIIQPQGMRALAEALKQNASLVEVRLSHQKYATGTDAEQAFASALEKNESIQKFSLLIRDVPSRTYCDRAITRNKDLARKRRLASSSS